MSFKLALLTFPVLYETEVAFFRRGNDKYYYCFGIVGAVGCIIFNSLTERFGRTLRTVFSLSMLDFARFWVLKD